MKSYIKAPITLRVIIILFVVLTLSDCTKKEKKIVIPSLSTKTPTSITETSATIGGFVSSDGGSTIIERGVCYSTNQDPSASDFTVIEGGGTGNFECLLTSLDPNTMYYVRAYALNNAGIGYGNEISFTTQQGTGGTVTDIDGNVYHTISIGMQIWMVENLKTTRFNNGNSIPLITDFTVWTNLTTPGYCWYNNDAVTYKNTYGALYNWFAINTTKLAPTGWHIPTDEEWSKLITYLGDEYVAGGKMKETGLFHWFSPNTGATNESGFSGLPGGGRNDGGAFYFIGRLGSWWSATEFSHDFGAWGRYLSNSDSKIIRTYCSKTYGFSLRCVKD